MGYGENGNAIILKFSIPCILTPFNYTNQMHSFQSVYTLEFFCYMFRHLCAIFRKKNMPVFLTKYHAKLLSVGSFFCLSFVVNIAMM